jgi:DNA repair protein RadA/Sms
MLLAVLEARCGLVIGARDVYLNVAGGLRIAEPAADLAVAAALVSSLFDRPVPASAVIFGEVGLAGEVRAVSQAETRLREAVKLGFDQAILPAAGGEPARVAGALPLRLNSLKRVGELVDVLADAGPANAPIERRASASASVAD